MRFDCTCNYLLITLLWVVAEGEGGVSMMRCRTASYWTVMHRLATSTVVTCCRCWSWERYEWFVDGADVGGSRGALSQHLLSNVWFVGFTASAYQWCSNLLLSLSKARVRWVSLRWSWCWRRLRCVVTATCSRPFAPSTVSASSTTRTLSVMSAARYGNCYCCRCHLSVITTTLSSCSVCLLHTAAFAALTLLVGHQEEHPAFKNWVMRSWCGYLSGARCRTFAYGPPDATASPNPIISCLI